MAKTRGGRQRTRHSARLMAAANAVAETPSTNVERAPSVERPPSVERQPSTDAVEIPSENVRSPPSVEMAT